MQLEYVQVEQYTNTANEGVWLLSIHALEH